MPPSFEEIGPHFLTTPPSVNNMIKTLEARGFLARERGAARTLRVLLPDAELREPAAPSRKRQAPRDVDAGPQVRLASAVIERLVPALRGAVQDLGPALNAVLEALDVELRAAGTTDEQRDAAANALVRAASIAQGTSPETRPGRRLPWWRAPR